MIKIDLEVIFIIGQRYPRDLTGFKFGKLTVLEKSDKSTKGRTYWKCLCECGNIKDVYRSNLISGDITSCGWAKYKLPKDLTGFKFSRLTVLKQVEKDEKYNKEGTYWLCRCEYGTEKILHRKSIGKVFSCGCLQIEKSTKHNMKNQRIYRIWQGMKTRCMNKNMDYYKNYGGREIEITERWLEFEGF